MRARLTDLVADMRAGKVETLVIARLQSGLYRAGRASALPTR